MIVSLVFFNDEIFCFIICMVISSTMIFCITNLWPLMFHTLSQL